jgi:hypothetical protein
MQLDWQCRPIADDCGICRPCGSRICRQGFGASCGSSSGCSIPNRTYHPLMPIDHMASCLSAGRRGRTLRDPALRRALPIIAAPHVQGPTLPIMSDLGPDHHPAAT